MVFKNKKHEPEKKQRSLDDTLSDAWDEVQKRLLCYELPYPQIKEQTRVDTACINMVDHEITVSKNFLDYLKNKGLDEETALLGVLSHEAGHYKIMPWDLKTLILMNYEASKVSPEKKDILTNYFSDVALNLELVMSKTSEEIRDVYACLDKTGDVDNILCNLYEKKTGLDFNSNALRPELKPILDELHSIKYTDKKKIYANLRKFSKIIAPLLKNENEQKYNQSSKSGEKKETELDNVKKYSISDLDSFDFSAYSAGDIKRALKEIAAETKNPAEFVEIYDLVKKDEKTESAAQSSRGTGICPGKGGNRQESSDNSALIEFYKTNAEKYELGISEKELDQAGGASNTNLKKWNIDEDPIKIDPFNSYGIIIPEITSMRSEVDGNSTTQGKTTPDLMILLDSSGSMHDPAISTSLAVLGSTCAARQYLKRGSSVCAGNFSNKTYLTEFTRNEDEIMHQLLNYQGGGTSLDSDLALTAIKKNSRECDVLLITDGFIFDLPTVIEKLSTRKNTNRISIIEIGNSILQKLAPYSKLTTYSVLRAEDIPKIIIQDMKKGGVI